MHNKTSELVTTLDLFGYCGLAELNKLIHAYMNSGEIVDGKCYAELPATWCDDGVYPAFDPSSGMVFLSNSDYQALVLTEYGVMQWYITRHNRYGGTLFDLAEKVINDLTTKDGEPLSYKDTVWHKDDLNEVYGWLSVCISDLVNTEADTADFYKAKELIAEAFILDRLPAVADEFKEAHEDWSLQLDNSKNAAQYDPEMNGGNDGNEGNADGWYETNLAEGFLKAMLINLEHEYDELEAEKYAEFIRNEMIKYLP